MKRMLTEGAAALGTELDAAKADALSRYAALLVERNKSVNLTRITEPEEIVAKHFLDSLTPLLTGRVKGRVIDVGSGAGFPGLVLKCAAPELDMTLLDSLNKRVLFLREAAREMGISEGIRFLHARAEEAARRPEYREKFDTVVSRAVANLRTLSEWCLPFLRVGGQFLALKGPLAKSEIEDAKGAIERLGGGEPEIFSADIPFAELNHKIVIIKKLRPTPTAFPRMGKKAAAIPAEKVR